MSIPFQVVDDDQRMLRGDSRRMFDFGPLAIPVAQGQTVEFELPFHPKDQRHGANPGDNDQLVLNALRRYFERRAIRVAFRKVEKGGRLYRVWAVT